MMIVIKRMVIIKGLYSRDYYQLNSRDYDYGDFDCTKQLLFASQRRFIGGSHLELTWMRMEDGSFRHFASDSM